MLDDIARLIARMTLGASIAAHGAQKAWGAFEGPGPVAAAGFMESLGFVPGARYAGAAASSEIIGGVLIALGAGGALGPATVISTMVVAQTSVHAKNGFFAQNGGVELGVAYATAALGLATGGFGRFSLDEAWGWQRLHDQRVTAIALAGGIAAALVLLAQRTPRPPAPETPAAVAHQLATDPIATTENHIAAASEDRPVPADLLVATDNSTDH